MKIKCNRAYRADLPLREGSYNWPGGKAVSVFDISVVEVVTDAGSPLVAYFLHPIVIGVVAVAGLSDRVLAYKQTSDHWVVVGDSFGMAVFVCAAAGLLGRLGSGCGCDRLSDLGQSRRLQKTLPSPLRAGVRECQLRHPVADSYGLI